MPEIEIGILLLLQSKIPGDLFHPAALVDMEGTSSDSQMPPNCP